MKIVEIDCSQIDLSGITLNASFTLHNPHQILALMFELQAKTPSFEIQPQRGMILSSDKKFIKIRLKPHLRGQAQQIENENNQLSIRATYYCEYNKKLLAKNNLKGWSKISKTYTEYNIPINLHFGAEVERLKQSIKRGSSMKNSKRQNSFQKFRDSSVKKAKDPRLNEDLDFLFRNESYARHSRQRKSRGTPRELEQTSSPRIIQSADLRDLRLTDSRTVNEIGSLPVGQALPNLSRGPQSSRGRGGQIVLLAVIAAVFLAVGEAFGSVFRS